MSNRVHIICHANAGQGDGRQRLQEVQTILSNYHLEYIVYETNYSTHAEVLAEQIIHRGYKPYEHFLIVIGGDGTLHEVINSLMRNACSIPVTYIPAGTGNDFYNTWQKGKSIQEIIEIMLFSKQVKEIPVFHFEEAYTQMSGKILNNMGFGFDAQVNAAVNRSRNNPIYKLLKRSKLKYLISLFTSLPKLKSFKVQGYMDEQYFELDKTYVAAILNSPFAGGGICLDGLTQAEKSEISLVLYHNITFFNAIPLLKKLLIDKQPQQSPNVTRLAGQKLTLKVQPATIGHVDGEVIPAIPSELKITLQSYPFYL